MNILKISQTYWPHLNEGGRSVKVRALAEAIARRGHRVVVLTADYGKSKRGTRLKIASQDSLTVEAVYLRTWARYRTTTVDPEVIGFCWKQLRKFDIVHLYGVYDLLGPVVAGFCRWWGVPYVLEPLGMFRPIVRKIALKRLYRRLLGWPVVRGAVRVIATSELERDELITEGIPAEQVVMRRNGVDLPDHEALVRGAFRREIGLGDGAPVVLYLGRVSRVKGLDLLVEAFSGLSTSATLVIMGPDDGDGCLQDLERLCARKGLNGRVRLLGPRFGADKFAVIADVDLLVLPSHSESFGNAAAEAVACGIPVVVTERCGIAPLLRDRAGLVVPCEVEALRSALARLIADRDLCDRLRAGATEVRQELSWDEPVVQMERLYMECTQAGRSPGL